MTQITALLIVFALTGGPIANAVCLTWCHSHLTMENCSEHMTQPAIVVGSGSCPALVADTPFVNEEGRISIDNSSLVVHPTATPLTSGRVSYISRDCQAVDGRRVQSVVLRL